MLLSRPSSRPTDGKEVWRRYYHSPLRTILVGRNGETIREREDGRQIREGRQTDADGPTRNMDGDEESGDARSRVRGRRVWIPSEGIIVV